MKLDVMSYVKQISDVADEVDWKNPKICAAYYSQVYYYVRHTLRLLALAAARMSFEDEVAHRRLLEHIAEEMSHEKMIVRDCKSFGYDVFDFPELPALKAFYRTTYYNIEHVSPWAIMGYITALEGLAVQRGEWLHQEITKVHGAGHATFLKLHGIEDQDHVAEAVKLIETRSEKEIEIIEESLALSVYLHSAMFKDLPNAVAGLKTKSTKAA